MDYLLDLLQGLGIAAAIGIRPFLPTLLVGALATQNLGLDFENTDFSFLESTGFLFAMLVAGLRRRHHRTPPAAPAGDRAPAARAALVLGALLAAGSIADHSDDVVARGPSRASPPRRSASSPPARSSTACAPGWTPRPRARCPLYAEGAALLGAGLSVLFPPLAVLVVAALAWLLLGGRRRQGEKYAGLRILK